MNSVAELKRLQRRFDLHVALVMDEDDVPKSTALFKAWLEGEAGLDKRLARG